MDDKKQKRVYIAWFPFSAPSDSMAYHVGAKAYHIHYFKKRRMLLAPFKYILASFKTLGVLYKERPDIIFVMNPPVFTVLIGWFYCRVNKSRYVVDTHSGIFTSTRWRFFLPLYRYLAKRALMNMLHNKPQADEVEGWGAPSMVLEPGPIQTTTDRNYPFRFGFNVVIISTYDEDEPIFEVIEAAKQLTEINFYITGNLQRAPQNLSKHTPDNVLLTDFLTRKDFLALLKGCDIAVCLTTADNTHQWGALEALEFARPIITSDWPVLRDYFSNGTIHIDNTGKSLAAAIEQMRDDYSFYLKGIENLRKEQRTHWDARFLKLIEILEKG